MSDLGGEEGERREGGGVRVWSEEEAVSVFLGEGRRGVVSVFLGRGEGG